MPMRNYTLLNDSWSFTYHDGSVTTVNVPHTWNNLDGQDGGNDYWRGTCAYRKSFNAPAFDKENEVVYLEFRGVNASAKVILNGKEVANHDVGYSPFRANVTDVLTAENDLLVEVDNSVNNQVYPQKADFTFYGGIYRDVYLVVLNKHHFDMDFFGGPGIAVNPTVLGNDSPVQVRTWHNALNAVVDIGF